MPTPPSPPSRCSPHDRRRPAPLPRPDPASASPNSPTSWSDCVHGGASVSFMEPFSKAEAVGFFAEIAEAAQGGRARRVRRDPGRPDRRHGAADPAHAAEPAAPGRSVEDAGAPQGRKNGIGMALMQAAERHARGHRQDADHARHASAGRRAALRAAGLHLRRGDPELCAFPGRPALRHAVLLEDDRRVRRLRAARNSPCSRRTSAI